MNDDNIWSWFDTVWLVNWPFDWANDQTEWYVFFYEQIKVNSDDDPCKEDSQIADAEPATKMLLVRP